MHVGNKKIHASIVIEVKEFQPHTAPGSFRKIILSFFNELLAALVFEVVTGPLHIQEIDSGPTIAFQIREASVAAPTARVKADFRGYILEFVVTQILVEHWILEAFGMEMAGKSIPHSDIRAFGTFFVRGVHADIAD